MLLTNAAGDHDWTFSSDIALDTSIRNDLSTRARATHNAFKHVVQKLLCAPTNSTLSKDVAWVVPAREQASTLRVYIIARKKIMKKSVNEQQDFEEITWAVLSQQTLADNFFQSEH